MPEVVTPTRRARSGAPSGSIAIATAPGNGEALQARWRARGLSPAQLSPSLLSRLFSSSFPLSRPCSPPPLSKVMAGGTGDVRKLFIFTTAQNYFGLVSESWDWPRLYNCLEINNFLDDGNQMLLRVQRSDAGISLSNMIDFEDTKDKVLVFFKLRPEVITDENLHNSILVSSMLESPINSLYQAVRQIFVPMLLKDQEWSRNFDPKLQNLLSELEAGLGIVLRRSDTSLSKLKFKEDDTRGILTPSDEFQFWIEQAHRGSKQITKERASYFKELFETIARVLAVRTIHEKLLYFSPASDEKITCLARVFEPFTGLNPVQYNPYTEPLWKAAVSQYEKIIAPAERKIAGKLKNYISEIQDSPQQLLQAFLKYEELVKRPTISKELMLERETLLARLTDSVKDFRLDFEKRCRGIPGDASGPLSGKNLSEVVNNIVWVDDTIKIAEALLSDLSGFRSFHRTAEDVLDQFKLYEQEQFDDWSRDVQSGLSDPRSGLCIEANSQIMELDPNDGSLRVHYSDRLVILLREVRQLSALGFVIPAKIQQVANIAQKFCKQAIILKQVAHFYNSIDQQMIQSQRPMMLQSALAFEQIIKVVVLMNIDLLRQQQRWKDGLQELRTGLASVEAQGVGEAGDEAIFSIMIDRNASGFLTIFSKAEDLFRRLLAVLHQHKEWIVIGQVDMEALVETHLSTVHDWEKNFKALKIKGKEAERLPSAVKVDCLNINCNPVKTVIDDLIQKLFDTLVLSLKKSIQARLHEIDTFVTEAMEILTIMPQSVEEIGNANLQYSKLQERKPQEKRSVFPRFYFIGDDDLLEILGQSTNPSVIQSHLKKLFAGINSVCFDEESKYITAMKSLQGEVVPFKNKVLLSNNVETWLNDLALEMKRTLKELLTECVTTGRSSQGAIDPSFFPSQILCLAEQIKFTEDVENAIKDHSLHQIETQLVNKLEHYTNIDTSSEDPGNIESGILELKLKALILDIIHNIDVVKQLNQVQVHTTEDWAWKKQVRFYMKSDHTCYVQMVDSELQYTYEYQVEINSNSGIFITMNPAGKGYGGRQKLPDNLKQLFRPVAMSRPDNELIAEVILYSEGFKDAKVLGRKLVAIFSLSRELLTPQQHYDWGLRALKTVLRGSGNLLRQLKKTGVKQEVNESHIVVQALRLNTMSKFTFADCTRFDALIKDVFPGIDFKEVEYDELSAALKQVFEEANYEIISNQIKKALELYEQLRQRMGVVIVGPSGAGKSTLWRMLRAALCKIGKVVKQYTMNPKAMPRHQLLGHIDMDTREWSDGVLTNSARQVVREPQDVSSWIICDGDIDPEWIESLNSVLDDNRLLTMPSGERIQFGPNVNFVFETHDLSCASPATISRMGMIFLSDEDTDLNSLIKSWLRNQPPKYRNNLENWIGDYFEKALQWVLKQVFKWARESPPDPQKPVDTYYDSSRGRLASYALKKPENLTADDFCNGQALPVIQTPDMQRGLDYFKPWLSSDTKQPFILVGPEGCGKGMLLRYAFSQLRSTQIATVHCSAQTTSRHLLQKLSQTCMVISTNTGRVYRPKDCERLVLYLKDINLPKLDKWGTSTLVAFLQQVRAKFTVDDYSHYFFTPCILTKWVLGLFRYDLEGGSSNHPLDYVLEIVAYEAQRLFRDKIVGAKELHLFDSILTSVFQGDWGSDVLDNMAGEVPGLYTLEELEPLLLPLKDEASQDGFFGPVFNYFTYRIQQNLHIVLIMDSANLNFIINCESNPALHKKCQVLWMEGWSDSSMKKAGVSKLNEAKALVDELNRTAGEQSVLLKTKQDEADAALQEITVSMQDASEQKTELERLKHKIAEEVVKIEERKSKIDDELKEVKPLVNEAKLAVGNIKPESLSEIRSLRMPPDVIRDILEGVLRLMGIFDTSWVSMKSFLAKRGVRDDIATFDARNIPKEIRESVEELLFKNKGSFDPKNAKRASTAAAPLAAWVKANVQYSHVLERIQPLETEQAGLELFQSRTSEAAKLEAEVSKAQETIKAAEVLINQLDREHKRWNAQVAEITEELATLPKRAQLAAAFITYLSAAPEDLRKSCLEEWTKSAGLAEFNLRRFLCTESEQLIWKSEGLPSDDLSIENALVILQDNNFITALELAVRFGKTLIIQEMDGVEPVLYPLLRRDLVAQGPRYVVQIGDKIIDYNEEFRLFLSTRNPNPFIPPDAASIVTEINFTTTRSGLRGQLLALTLQHEKPDLEEQKTKLLQQEEDKKIQLAKLEESLLEERDAYLPLAESASKMYFIISDLSKINNMYRFSLAAFLRLFQRALQNKQVLVVQALRPDRLQSAMALFACKTLGLKELSPPPLNLKRLYKETLEIEPILIIISPGADPSQELQELASAERSAECYHQVAMGQGQADLAVQMLKECARNGDWLCLKNLHLVVSWLPILEKDYRAVVEKLPEDDKPSFFGLPANMARSSQRMVSSQVISQLRILGRSVTAGCRFDREIWSNELSPVLNLWKKLNQNSNLIHQKVLPPNDRQGSPILSFIVLEQFNAIRLVQSVHQSLAALSKVIRGTTLLSSEVQKLASALLNQK
ncbi:hypothetical protein CB1_000877044, partial [Camelus ferus]